MMVGEQPLPWFALGALGSVALLLLGFFAYWLARQIHLLLLRRERRCRLPKYWENARAEVHAERRRRAAERSSEVDDTRRERRSPWDGSDAEAFEDLYPVSLHTREVLETLLNDTINDDDTRFNLVRALRLESSRKWAAYGSHAATVKVIRGSCTFAGRGPPATVEAFPEEWRECEDLDQDICEVYLWHGTTPRTALGIMENGFRVDAENSVGKRFGAGGYFCEDPRKADRYAGHGEGVYKSCYAMLLCRVVLGRQFHTQEYRSYDATWKARRRYDSTLAEPRGQSYREFVVFNSEQVYPEYALVYERCAPMGPNFLGHAHSYWSSTSLPLKGTIPPYWFNAIEGVHCFHDMYPSDLMVPVIQSLMDSMVTGIRVAKVLRIEDIDKWSEYMRAQDAIRRRRGACKPCESQLGGRTAAGLPARKRQELAAEVNEVYLWQGSSPHLATSQLERYRRGSQGSPSQRGFTDSAALADRLSSDDGGGYYRDLYAMLLCRVTLGSVNLAATGANAVRTDAHGFDSAMVRDETLNNAYEVVVFADEQIYPEYAIIYERRRGTSTCSSSESCSEQE
eukprot:TRINITY_DN29918_c0_g1_i1.p1 TRINITY_DN29918_c0_g1~~TRINITY_DN29918_c0_g1_i1.p1  ORF type:complete len:568 (+),score=96.97 TRINITY_DN29918_c0_g1_i1:18-1721(+)